MKDAPHSATEGCAAFATLCGRLASRLSRWRFLRDRSGTRHDGQRYWLQKLLEEGRKAMDIPIHTLDEHVDRFAGSAWCARAGSAFERVTGWWAVAERRFGE